MEEDKQKICDLLVPVLQATAAGKRLTALEYECDQRKHRETVTIRFQGIPQQKANVTGDSGVAMIYDILCKVF